MSPDQAETLRNDWVTQRIANPGIPAVLSGGLKWSPTQLNPKDMALLELSQFTDGKIAVLLGVPPFLVGLPAGGDSMTYERDQPVRLPLALRAQAHRHQRHGRACPSGCCPGGRRSR